MRSGPTVLVKAAALRSCPIGRVEATIAPTDLAVPAGSAIVPAVPAESAELAGSAIVPAEASAQTCRLWVQVLQAAPSVTALATIAPIEGTLILGTSTPATKG